jgi:recombination protein RecR
MNAIDKLTEIFSHFPGIGPRQARRFVYYLLTRDQNTLETLTKSIDDLKRETAQCSECKRYFTKNGSSSPACSVCADTKRDKTLLMIVPRDADFEAVEKSGGYKGLYFILGGSLPILEKEPAKRIRINELKKKIETNKKEIKEIILAMNANAEGENTADFIKQTLEKNGFEFSTLGRGLSTGAELEYADPETLKNALLHRTK